MPSMLSVTKVLNPDKGFSCVFRQWSAESHCHLLHGYDLIFEFEFACPPENLTKEGWVVDFGAFDTLKYALAERFDHTLIIASDDPYRNELLALAKHGIATVYEMPHIGCEMFAIEACKLAAAWLDTIGRANSVQVVQVTVREHGANAVTYYP